VAGRAPLTTRLRIHSDRAPSMAVHALRCACGWVSGGLWWTTLAQQRSDRSTAQTGGAGWWIGATALMETVSKVNMQKNETASVNDLPHKSQPRTGHTLAPTIAVSTAT